MRTRFARAAVLLFVGVAAVACSKALDIGGLETELGNQLSTKLDTTGITVDCPDDIKAESGGEFDCTGTVPSAGTLTIHVKQTDGDGHVTWEVVDATTGPSGATASGPTGST
ncbi:MAG: DUF4333 domain-containing protein [Actinomycetota bacterium]